MGGSHDGDGVVVKYSGDIFRGELVGGVTDEQTCLANGTVADYDTPRREGVSGGCTGYWDDGAGRGSGILDGCDYHGGVWWMEAVLGQSRWREMQT